MHYYQLIYTASENGRTGQPGFGIRSVSTDFPEYLLSLIDGKMTSYNSGSFENISGTKLVENPKVIYDYPKSFFYNIIKQESGKKIYFLGRIVATGFDYPYFKTGNPSTRTGNYVSHIYIFEETPDSSIFDILFEKPNPGNNQFVPQNILPDIGNGELKSLLLGPSTPIEITENSFASSFKGVPDESIEVLFDLVSALNEGKRLIVKMDAQKVPAVCAGLMRLLPEKYAQDMTFSINHQEEGITAGTRITFINQYYQYSAPAGNVKIVDYINASHTSTPLENKWRAQIIKNIQGDDLSAVRIITSWLLNKLSVKLVEQSDDLNWALIRYMYVPEEFTIGEIVETEGLLPILSKIINADASRNELLMNLLRREFSEAQDVSDINVLITILEKIAANGIPMDSVHGLICDTITKFVTASPESLCSILQVHPVAVIQKYIDFERTSKFKDYLSSDSLLSKWSTAYSIFYRAPFPVKEIMMKMQSLHIDESQVKSVLSEICPKAADRVSCYIEVLKDHPDDIDIYEPYLMWDKLEADKVDYVSEFKNSFNSAAYAPYFIQAIDFRKESLPPIDLLKLCKEISDKNNVFKDLLIKNPSIYSVLYKRTVEYIRGKEPKSFDNFIDTSVLPLIADTNQAKAGWLNLRDVLSLSIQEGKWKQECYDLAVKIQAASYIKKLAPAAFGHFNTLSEISKFVDALCDIAKYSNDDIIDSVKKISGSHIRGYYIVALAKKKDLAFATVEEYVEKLSIKDSDSLYSEYFTKEYRFIKFKNIFKKFMDIFKR